MVRYNELENNTLRLIMSKAKVQQLFQDYNGHQMVEIKKEHSNKNKLFLDACMPYRTEYGNQKKTEFVLHCPMYGINWRIECKSQKTYSELVYRAMYSLKYVPEISEDKYILILEGAFNRPKILYELAQEILKLGLQNKVWFGTLKQFEELLTTEMAA